MNPGLEKLQAYPFERLTALLREITGPAHLLPIPLYIGEPKHAPPSFVVDSLRQHLAHLGTYPSTKGLTELRSAGAAWATRRFQLPEGTVDPETQVLPVTGTREALFAFVQLIVDCHKGAHSPLVLMPNPGYQIYEGAALLAGAEPYFLNTVSENSFLPDLDAVPAKVWERCQLLFLCSPANPVGTVMDIHYLQKALRLAEQYDFVIAADECYADIYAADQTPPPSLLTAALAMGNKSMQRCLTFHSLSKRSNLPGLRSGLVVGDAALVKPFLLYRTYHGCAMPLPTQHASVLAWNDDAHVETSRQRYCAKFDAVVPILQSVIDVHRPAGGFFLWLNVGGDDAAFTADLFAQQHVSVIPGSYLARGVAGANPGAGFIRISLVAPEADCVQAAHRIREFISHRK
jgi:N-succinyldiaminopimelate aminotransferase